MSQQIHDRQLSQSMPWGELRPPKWYQSAHKMQVAAGVILSIGAVVTAAGLCCMFCNPGNLGFGFGIGAGVFALQALAIGSVLFFKPYWKDPAYRTEQREKILDCLQSDGYDKTRSLYRAKWLQYRLVTDTEINVAIMEHHFAGKPYREICHDPRNNLTQLIRDGIFYPGQFTGQLLRESRDLTVYQMLQQYGWQPFADGVLFAEDSEDRSTIQDRFVEETRGLQWNQLYERYNINRQFWLLFEKRIAKKEDWIPQTEAQLEQIGFEQMIERYGWELFSHEILSVQSDLVQRANITYFTRVRFTTFSENIYLQAQHFNLIPPLWAHKIHELHERHVRAKRVCAEQVRVANETYEQAVQSAVQVHETACAPVKNNVNRVKIRIMENKDKAMVEQLRNELVMAEALLSCFTASADRNKIAAIEIARREKEMALSDAQWTLEMELDRINADWQDYLRTCITEMQAPLSTPQPSAPPAE